MTTIEKRLRQLRTQIGKLAPTEGRPIARRNARTRVLAALRAVRKQIDEEYPAIIVRGEVRRLKTWQGRVARLEAKGYVCVYSDTAIREYAIAGVPIRSVTVTESPYGDTIRHFVPRWAKAIGSTRPLELRAVKKSVALQHAALAAQALTQGD